MGTMLTLPSFDTAIPSGPAGGNLGGDYPSPIVVGLTADGLTVDITGNNAPAGVLFMTNACTTYLTQDPAFTYDSGNLTAPVILPSAAQTTYSGSITGSAVWSMPFQGTSYKKFFINMQALHDAGGTITYPTAFAKAPYLYGTASAVAISSTSTTVFTIAVAATITGNVFVEGY